MTSFSSSLSIAQPNPDGSLPVPVAAGASAVQATAAQWEERAEHLQQQVDSLQEILAKPLNEILADREKSQEAAAAWDSFGAMWMLSQRAMRCVALELATAQGVSETEVVARAMRYANEVLNGDGENLGGTIAEAQMAHIARHKPFLRKQFRQG
ncbi:hypothetical protein [Simplicispira psychrophila]|uniref:hypothetical protein n=1 Tax=Simplicispira psychrophila TaxID=80882 RepID=UPI0004834027|nr:hypothetical protein [Simplicispira psychrophila]